MARQNCDVPSESFSPGGRLGPQLSAQCIQHAECLLNLESFLGHSLDARSEFFQAHVNRYHRIVNPLLHFVWINLSQGNVT